VDTEAISLQASDVSGQHIVQVHGVPLDATVGELTRSLIAKMELPPNDASGGPVNYQLRLDRDGRHLHAGETVGDLGLQPNDKVRLLPQISAGMRSVGTT
jgi:hypothetical protein